MPQIPTRIPGGPHRPASNGYRRRIPNLVSAYGARATATVNADTITGGTTNVNVENIDHHVNIVGKCDDVAGDGSNVVQYVEAYKHTFDNAGAFTSTLIGTFTDSTLTTAYTPTNGVDCDTLGVAARLHAGRITLEAAGTWSPGPLVQSYTVTARTIGDTNNPPTFTDGFANVTTLDLGIPVGFNSASGDLIDTTAIVTSFAGDRVEIVYTELAT